MLLPQWTRYTLGILNLALDKKSDPLFTSIGDWSRTNLEGFPEPESLFRPDPREFPILFLKSCHCFWIWPHTVALLVEIALEQAANPDVKLHHTHVPFGEFVSRTPRGWLPCVGRRDRRPGSAPRRESR